MQTNESLIEVLNDLVKINNDRITGYEKAIDEINDEDIDLKGMFRKMANDSQEYVKELSELILRKGGEVSTDTTVPGKIYRAWMDVKAAFSGSDRKTILSSCEFGEDAAQKAYKEALSSDAEIDAESRQVIMSQKASLKESHDMIKKYRDLQTA
ncbi:PA2169 family four-helix-bundle protein [Sediminibacterium roseum]|uniref:PA2169 family four-helix-bundle protein n=1 Tax=Sediminibacterium roseum TaxID=1978412 RepID=A0ABW9ZTQ2_9BACT|nr:PA2169 family four-helix-bundle protein [Sediminibacterium roseum]NCI50523.1 PA2169 family four-helix-bundle protein [Sediminibacterium roseum]